MTSSFHWSATCGGCAAAATGELVGSWEDAVRVVDEWIAQHRATVLGCSASPISSSIGGETFESIPLPGVGSLAVTSTEAAS